MTAPMMSVAGPHVLAFDFGWGHLQHHDQPCDECDGGEEDDDVCFACTGDGAVRWGSFYVQDHGECDHCKRSDVPIAEMFEEAYVCLPCYVRSHAKMCGCPLWSDAEISLLSDARYQATPLPGEET